MKLPYDLQQLYIKMLSEGWKRYIKRDNNILEIILVDEYEHQFVAGHHTTRTTTFHIKPALKLMRTKVT